MNRLAGLFGGRFEERGRKTVQPFCQDGIGTRARHVAASVSLPSVIVGGCHGRPPAVCSKANPGLYDWFRVPAKQAGDQGLGPSVP
jgi:hypothetical protein